MLKAIMLSIEAGLNVNITGIALKGRNGSEASMLLILNI
jgi:hypothetical protein